MLGAHAACSPGCTVGGRTPPLYRGWDSASPATPKRRSATSRSCASWSTGRWPRTRSSRSGIRFTRRSGPSFPSSRPGHGAVSIRWAIRRRPRPPSRSTRPSDRSTAACERWIPQRVAFVRQEINRLGVQCAEGCPNGATDTCTYLGCASQRRCQNGRWSACLATTACAVVAPPPVDGGTPPPPAGDGGAPGPNPGPGPTPPPGGGGAGGAGGLPAPTAGAPGAGPAPAPGAGGAPGAGPAPTTPGQPGAPGAPPSAGGTGGGTSSPGVNPMNSQPSGGFQCGVGAPSNGRPTSPLGALALLLPGIAALVVRRRRR